jgi:hypothetical protein
MLLAEVRGCDERSDVRKTLNCALFVQLLEEGHPSSDVRRCGFIGCGELHRTNNVTDCGSRSISLQWAPLTSKTGPQALASAQGAAIAKAIAALAILCPDSIQRRPDGFLG